MFGAPFDPVAFNNLKEFSKFGASNGNFNFEDLDQEQIDKIVKSMGLNLDALDNNPMMSNYGINKVMNHFMAMARSGVLKQEEIHNFYCEPFETDTEHGFKLVWRK